MVEKLTAICAKFKGGARVSHTSLFVGAGLSERSAALMERGLGLAATLRGNFQRPQPENALPPPYRRVNLSA
jgi:hypothetical protein